MNWVKLEIIPITLQGIKQKHLRHKKKLKISHLKCTEKFNCDEVNDIYSWKRFKAELNHKLLDINL